MTNSSLSSMEGGALGMSKEEKPRELKSGWYNSYEVGLRSLGLVCCLVAAVIVGINKETNTVSVSLSESLPPLRLPVTAKWYYLSSFVYFVTCNAIACTYAATSLALFLVTKTKPYNTTLVLLIIDLIMVALLFSANGALSFIGLIALKGNSHLQWHKMCGTFEGFCRRSGTSLALSWVGSFVFLMLVALSAMKLHKRSRPME